MTAEERILTLHPQGKKGVRIPLHRYLLMRETLLQIFMEFPEITHKELCLNTIGKLEGKLDGSIMWLLETVILDLEARKLVERTSHAPVRLRRTNVQD
jgi:hypothetical protein